MHAIVFLFQYDVSVRQMYASHWRHSFPRCAGPTDTTGTFGLGPHSRDAALVRQQWICYRQLSMVEQVYERRFRTEYITVLLVSTNRAAIVIGVRYAHNVMKI